MNKQTIRDADVAGKRVFVRVDFNVPLADGKVTDDSRIRAAIPTIKSLVDQGARVILASHLGRPKGKVQDGLRLRPVGQRLTELIRRNVPVTGDALGDRDGGRAQAHAARRGPAAREPALPRRRGGQRPGIREDARLLCGHLRQRRVRDRPPGACLDRRDRRAPAGICRAPDGARARDALQAARVARAPIRGHPRRRQGVRQDRRHRQPAHQGRPARPRRRDGQHLPAGPGQERRQEPRRARPRRRREADPHRGREARRPDRPPGRRDRRQGGHARNGVQDAPCREDPGLVAHRRHGCQDRSS